MVKITTLKKKLSRKTVGLIVFGLVFAGIGTWKFIDSYAAVPPNPPVSFFNVSNIEKNSNQTNVFTWTDTVTGIGTQSIIGVGPSGKLTFTSPVKQVPASICYHAKVYNSPKSSPPGTPASVTFVGTRNFKTVTLPDDGNYHEVCLQTSTKQQLPFHVENKSKWTDVLIYQAVARYESLSQTSPTPTTTPTTECRPWMPCPARSATE